MDIEGSAKRAGALAAVFLVFACGASQGGGFASGSSASPPSDAGEDTSGDETTTTYGDDAGQLHLVTSSDAATGVKFDCQPGTYAGMFQVHVTTDAGLLPQLVSFNVSGTLSIVLVGHVTPPTSTSGESFAQPILTIAPGAKLSGVDMTFGGTFNADVSGQLDCPMKAFSGTLANGVYEYPGDSGSLMMTGSLSATYDGTVMPPALTMGVMNLGSPQLMLGASGPWSATLQK
jgi:hypothetical protein